MKSDPITDKFSHGWIDSLDGRLAIAKDLRERFTELTNDLGGLNVLSYQQRSLVEHVIFLDYWLATQERELIEGREFDVGRWTQAVNSLQGIFSKLGLSRSIKEVNLADLVNV